MCNGCPSRSLHFQSMKFKKPPRWHSWVREGLIWLCLWGVVTVIQVLPNSIH